MDTVARSLEEFEAEAAKFALSLQPKKDGATFVTLSGELGAGKTAFTKIVARTFGVEEMVTSPTFVLEKRYALSKSQPFAHLVHIDAYRLEKGSDLAPLGFSELLNDPGNLIMLEWPERVQDALPSPDRHLSFAVIPDGSHTISYG